MPVRAVVLDIGETVLDDTREWHAWADWIGVGRHTFSTVLGAVTAAGRDNAETFRYFKPDFDVAAERQRREETGNGEQIEESDLYSDVRPALAELRASGVWVGLAGNQTARAGSLLRKLDLPVDAIATSAEWGVAKPDPAFFRHVVELASVAPRELLYVGDHRDNDVVAGHGAGLWTALIRRGPWGRLWADDPAVEANADWVIDTLTELPWLIAGT
ncbi:HAD family hydrolase [Amycolatopsis solani]|uniref:HAD family hydrolase n=1 Tax=Amycolatopsis solani TaxID=3028615 RepID=UPI0025B16334|nr:HAD family hydrolase [Amycolatopsis sp. MEP2-6]